MRFSKSDIKTLRDAPSNARTEGFGWLVRASYLTRENEITDLGQRVITRLQEKDNSLFEDISLPVIKTEHGEIHFAISTGKARVLQCPKCQYAARKDLARFAKERLPAEEPLPTEKLLTPNCHTIDTLTDFLNIPPQKTAKAIMLTRKSDKKLVFVVVRGDMQLSEAKLKAHIGDFEPATYEEISASGASAGFASPIGLKNTLIIVDDLIPQSPNLVAGANEDEYHLLNVNYGRDYTAEVIADLAKADEGDPCPNCDGKLELFKTDLIAESDENKLKIYPEKFLQALAEKHHDKKGLTFPALVAPFDIYLLVIPGRKINTFAVGNEYYEKLQNAGYSVLYDDRDTRAGSKFTDADFIGAPLRITIGERGLKENNLELKLRLADNKEMIALDALLNRVDELLG